MPFTPPGAPRTDAPAPRPQRALAPKPRPAGVHGLHGPLLLPFGGEARGRRSTRLELGKGSWQLLGGGSVACHHGLQTHAAAAGVSSACASRCIGVEAPARRRARRPRACRRRAWSQGDPATRLPAQITSTPPLDCVDVMPPDALCSAVKCGWAYWPGCSNSKVVANGWCKSTCNRCPTAVRLGAAPPSAAQRRRPFGRGGPREPLGLLERASWCS
jgi:hypothetical protein